MKHWMLLLALVLFSNILVAQKVGLEWWRTKSNTTADLQLIYKKSVGPAIKKQSLFFLTRTRITIPVNRNDGKLNGTFTSFYALSYNGSKFSGFGPIAIVQTTDRTNSLKLGGRYMYQSKDFFAFVWLVTPVTKAFGIENYMLLKNRIKLGKSPRLAVQFEQLIQRPFQFRSTVSGFQRIRMGYQYRNWTSGIGGDARFALNNQKDYQLQSGVFIRYDF